MSGSARLRSSMDLGTVTFEARVTDVLIQMANGSAVLMKHARMTMSQPRRFQQPPSTVDPSKHEGTE